MSADQRRPTGRPLPGEFADYAADDIAHVEGDDAVAALERVRTATQVLFRGLTDADVEGVRYAPEKWTMREVLGHLIDDERIFAYRLLCVARGDDRPLAGFDEERYVRGAHFETRALAALLAEYDSVRSATIALVASLSDEEARRRGTVNGYEATPRGLAFHIVGHELRHLRSLRERYLPLVTERRALARR